MSKTFWALLALVVGISLGYGARYLQIQSGDTGYKHDPLKVMRLAEQSRSEFEALQTHYAALQGRLVVEESTRKSLESTLQASQTELSALRERLAFYDRLLPPGPSGSVGVRALDIEQHGPTLQYRTLFMRNAPGAEPFSGVMQFVANGRQDGKVVDLTLEPVKAPTTVDADGSAQTNPLALNFEQFQRSEGLLALPQGFTPKTVTLNVLEGDTVRVSRTVNLSPDD